MCAGMMATREGCESVTYSLSGYSYEYKVENAEEEVTLCTRVYIANGEKNGGVSKYIGDYEVAGLVCGVYANGTQYSIRFALGDLYATCTFTKYKTDGDVETAVHMTVEELASLTESLMEINYAV